jgi:hypothetical protein
MKRSAIVAVLLFVSVAIAHAEPLTWLVVVNAEIYVLDSQKTVDVVMNNKEKCQLRYIRHNKDKVSLRLTCSDVAVQLSCTATGRLPVATVEIEGPSTRDDVLATCM